MVHRLHLNSHSKRVDPEREAILLDVLPVLVAEDVELLACVAIKWSPLDVGFQRGLLCPSRNPVHFLNGVPDERQIAFIQVRRRVPQDLR